MANPITLNYKSPQVKFYQFDKELDIQEINIYIPNHRYHIYEERLPVTFEIKGEQPRLGGDLYLYSSNEYGHEFEMILPCDAAYPCTSHFSHISYETKNMIYWRDKK